MELKQMNYCIIGILWIFLLITAAIGKDISYKYT